MPERHCAGLVSVAWALAGRSSSWSPRGLGGAQGPHPHPFVPWISHVSSPPPATPCNLPIPDPGTHLKGSLTPYLYHPLQGVPAALAQAQDCVTPPDWGVLEEAECAPRSEGTAGGQEVTGALKPLRPAFGLGGRGARDGGRLPWRLLSPAWLSADMRGAGPSALPAPRPALFVRSRRGACPSMAFCWCHESPQ